MGVELRSTLRPGHLVPAARRRKRVSARGVRRHLRARSARHRRRRRGLRSDRAFDGEPAAAGSPLPPEAPVDSLPEPSRLGRRCDLQPALPPSPHQPAPAGGSERQLKRMAARIMSQPLDHAKPLWETWIVEGLEGDRFAVISKIHHCMIDGMSGLDLASKMMSSTPEDLEIEPPSAFVPRPAPSPGELLADELGRQARLPLSLLERLAGGADDEPAIARSRPTGVEGPALPRAVDRRDGAVGRPAHGRDADQRANRPAPPVRLAGDGSARAARGPARARRVDQRRRARDRDGRSPALLRAARVRPGRHRLPRDDTRQCPRRGRAAQPRQPGVGLARRPADRRSRPARAAASARGAHRPT